MNPLKFLTFVGKITGLVPALDVILFMDTKAGVIVSAAASII